MNKDVKITIIIVAIALTIIIGNILQVALTKEVETIQSVIIDAEYIEDGDYVKVAFDNNETYNINYKGYQVGFDFTANSELVIKLHKTSWWLMPNTDDIWGVVSYMKVPNN